MSKTVTCPVKHFEGVVELKDPLPYLTVLKFEKIAREKPDTDIGEKFLPVILESVEAEGWKLKNLSPSPTVETFPGTPRLPVYELIAWLLGELTKIYKGNEDGDPNE